MTLTKWNPFIELEAMLDAYGRTVNRRNSRGNGHEVMTTADWAPVVDIKETEGEYLIKAELPEVAKENVKVSLNDGVLVIQGERKMEELESDKTSKYHRVERSYGSFARSFSLPEGVSATEIRAEHKEGMLYVHLPKQTVAPAKSIEVTVN